MRSALVVMLTLCALLQSLFVPTRAEGFDLRAHEVISFRAVLASRLDQVLREQMGFLRGRTEPVNGRPVLTWITEGSRLEDSPIFRVRHHFHNPTLPWDQAGLRVLGVQIGESSVIWGQDRGQVIGGNHSWHDARAAFFRALTASTNSERQQGFAETFQTLGHLIHLIQDAASPAHTRNDAHLSYSGIGDPDSFHTWAELNLGAILSSSSTQFDPSILALSTNSLAPIPIAHIIDTERYRQTRIPEAGTNIGIAEYSNANFFSDDTIFSPDFPFPRISSADLITERDSKTGELRRYFVKTRDGEVGYRLATISALFKFLPAPIPVVALDDFVLQDYGRLLFPRAIGYSAGLLDYFFRGRIEIAPPARFVYGLAQFVEGNAGAFTKLRFKVRNATPNEETPLPGQLIAVVQYRKPFGNLFENPFADLPAALSFAVSLPQTVTLTRDFTELTFDFPDPNAIPTNAADVFLTVVYRGPLGLEADAVLVGGKDLFEPDPVDWANVTDYDCFQGTLVNVGNSTLFPPFVPRLQTQRDLNQDGFGPDVLGPWTERGLFLKTFPLSQPPPDPSLTDFDLQLPARTAPQYARLVLLQDQPAYGLALFTTAAQEVSGLQFFNDRVAVRFDGVSNRLFVENGELIREVTLFDLYRGLSFTHLHLFLSSDAMPACLPQTVTAPPALMRIPGILPAE